MSLSAPYEAFAEFDSAEEEEDIWHVMFAADDIKVLSLDQLDDAFRLNLIDESTQVWKEGMAGWLPLGVVAGIDDDEAEEAPVPAHSYIAPAPTYSSGATGSPGAEDLFASPFSSGAPASAGSAAAVSGPAASSLAPLPAPAPLPRPAPVPVISNAPLSAMPLSTAPVAVDASFDSTPHRWDRWVLVSLAALGFATVLYRNDVFRSWSEGSGLEANYLQLEDSVLGAPGFGTPRAAEKLAAEQTEWLESSAKMRQLAEHLLPTAAAETTAKAADSAQADKTKDVESNAAKDSTKDSSKGESTSKAKGEPAGKEKKDTVSDEVSRALTGAMARPKKVRSKRRRSTSTPKALPRRKIRRKER